MGKILLKGKRSTLRLRSLIALAKAKRPSWNCHEEVVKILLGQQEVYPDKPDIYCQAPLCHAAHIGHAVVVKILLKLKKVNADKPNSKG